MPLPRELAPFSPTCRNVMALPGKIETRTSPVDLEIKAGSGANLLLDRQPHSVRVDHPGNGDQAEQRGSKKRRNRHP